MYIRIYTTQEYTGRIYSILEELDCVVGDVFEEITDGGISIL